MSGYKTPGDERREYARADAAAVTARAQTRRASAEKRTADALERIAASLEDLLRVCATKGASE